MSDELVDLIKSRLRDDAELAIMLYKAYRDKGRRGVVSVINELLSKEGLGPVRDEDR